MLFGTARNRHVAEEWNTRSINLQGHNNLGGLNGWHYLDWFGAYYQSQDWWIYHYKNGWMYPESDGREGVWLYWDATDSWIWTRGDFYPVAWDMFTETWFEISLNITTTFPATNL